MTASTSLALTSKRLRLGWSSSSSSNCSPSYILNYRGWEARLSWLLILPLAWLKEAGACISRWLCSVVITVALMLVVRSCYCWFWYPLAPWKSGPSCLCDSIIAPCKSRCSSLLRMAESDSYLIMFSLVSCRTILLVSAAAALICCYWRFLASDI